MEIKTSILNAINLSENCAVYDVMWKTTAEKTNHRL